MKPLSRKTKARISGALSPTFLLSSVMGVGALVVLVHLAAVVVLVLGIDVPWLRNTVMMGPAVAIIAMIIAGLRRQMAVYGWGAVHSGALPKLIEDMQATSNTTALHAALATRVQKQGWLSWSCVMDVLSSQGLSRGEYEHLKWQMLCSWGPVYNLHGEVATRACFRKHLGAIAWNHGQMDINTRCAPLTPALAMPTRF